MGNFKWSITIKKVLIQVVIVGVAGIASVYGNSPYWLAIAPIANGLINYIKHHKD